MLLAPASYAPLTQDEVFKHFDAVAAQNGPTNLHLQQSQQTHFSFSPELVSRLSQVPNVAAIKMLLPADGDFAGEIGRLR